MSHREPLSFSYTTVPANAGTVVILDSTHGLTSAPTTTPGNYRHRWAGARVFGSVKITDENATLKQKVLTDNGGTSSDWEEEASGSNTVTAGTTYTFNWMPSTPDFQLALVAGATAPTTVDVKVTVVWDRSKGS